MARAYSCGLRNREHGFGVYGDIYVSSCTYAHVPGREKVRFKPGLMYPASGFVISKEFAKFGGPEALFRMCHECPANVRAHEIASCAGDIYQRPESPDTEAQLQSIISRLGLEREVSEGFPATRPLWFGLWAVSPVPARALPVLRLLISEMLAEDTRDMEAAGKVDHDQLRQFSHLAGAIERAESSGLSLHVELLPLGHTDFGIYTIFPHCPFCKASARVGRWQRKYPSQLYTCEVCGTQFYLAETGRAERMDWDCRELRETLGDEEFRKFAGEYLVARGEAVEAAAAIVEATENAEVERKAVNRQHAEMEKQKKRFLDEHIFVGLPCLPAPSSEFPLSAEEQAEAESGSSGWFTADNVAEVLRRCAARDIKVTMLQHHSSGGENDRFEMRELKEPLEVLAKWRAEGCDEKFYACCRVPDSLVREPKQR